MCLYRTLGSHSNASFLPIYFIAFFALLHFCLSFCQVLGQKYVRVYAADAGEGMYAQEEAMLHNSSQVRKVLSLTRFQTLFFPIPSSLFSL